MNYTEVAERLSDIDDSRIIGCLGRKSLPLFIVQMGGGKKRVILSGGIHGDEPAGTYALLSFLENDIHRYLKDFSFTIFPCINPVGFEHGTRKNGKRSNINREFIPGTRCRENSLVMSKLSGKYDFAMDLHETWPDEVTDGDDEPTGDSPCSFYLWEICKEKERRIGEKIIQSVRDAGLTICTWPKIFDDVTNGDGVIWYPEGCGTACYAAGTSFDSYLAKQHTPQAFTIETPLGWRMEDRILAHKLSIITALENRR